MPVDVGSGSVSAEPPVAGSVLSKTAVTGQLAFLQLGQDSGPGLQTLTWGENTEGRGKGVIAGECLGRILKLLHR